MESRSLLLALLVASSLAVAQAPGTLSYGIACGGAGAPASLILPSSLRPGAPGSLVAANLPPSTIGFLNASWQAVSWLGIPLPLPLGAIGMPNCTLYVPPDATFMFQAGPNGTYVNNFTVPVSPLLTGADFFAQAVFAQPGLNPSSTGATNAVAGRIGMAGTPTSMVTQISQFGITYRFAQPVPAGQFVNGDWFVVGPAQIVDMQPPCVNSGGRIMNGAMINPNPATMQHGYDSLLYGAANAARYQPALNVALNVSASQPLLFQPNQSLIKIISNTDTNLVPQIRTCSVLTCVSSVPPADSFRPPYGGNDHQVLYDASMIDWSALRALQPAAGMPHIPTEAAKFERPWLDHCPGWDSRFLHPVDNMPDYGRDFTALYGQATLLANVNVSQAERRTLVVRLVQIGIDSWGNVRNGCRWEGVGGHNSGRKMPILFAGKLLRDQDMLAVGQNYRSFRNPNGTWQAVFGEDCQTFTVEQTGPGQINFGHGGYTTAHLGLPEFGFAHVHEPYRDQVGWQTDPYRRCCTANAWVGEVLCARVMGLQAAWNHDVLFRYMDRYMQVETSGWTRTWLPWAGSMWDMHRPAN